MYCWSCGKEISDNAYVCVHCGVRVDPMAGMPRYYKASFVLGILSLCIPMHGAILGIIGLSLACIAKRKSAIIMNIIGIVIWVGLIAFLMIMAQRSMWSTLPGNEILAY